MASFVMSPVGPPPAPTPEPVGPPVAVAIGFQWMKVGVLVLDEAGRVCSSLLTDGPAVYRIRVQHPDGPLTYVGQAADLQGRFEAYRFGTPLELPDNAAKEPNQQWMLRQVKTAIVDGHEVFVDVIAQPTVAIEAGKPDWFPTVGMRDDTNRERLALEGVAVATEVGVARVLNYIRSVDADWLLNDRETRLEFY